MPERNCEPSYSNYPGHGTPYPSWSYVCTTQIHEREYITDTPFASNPNTRRPGNVPLLQRERFTCNTPPVPPAHGHLEVVPLLYWATQKAPTDAA